MGDFIEEEIPKPKKGTKKMSKKEALELPPLSEPKTIKLAIRVKTLVIVGVLLASHGLVLWLGMKAPGMYDNFVDGLVEARTVEAQAVAEPVATTELKASQ